MEGISKLLKNTNHLKEQAILQKPEKTLILQSKSSKNAVQMDGWRNMKRNWLRYPENDSLRTMHYIPLGERGQDEG